MPDAMRTLILVLTLSIFSVGASAQTDTKVVVIPMAGDDVIHFYGPTINIPQAVIEAAGFSVCHSETYDQLTTLVSDVLAKCNKPELMLACRPTGDTIFQLAAHAPRADVTYDTGSVDNNTTETRTANGSEWYFHAATSGAWGFAPIGSVVNKNACDVASLPSDFRMCVHALKNKLDGGYRCGANISFDINYERVFLHR